MLTPEGFRRIGDLAVGDLVVGSNGLPTPVLGVYPQGASAVYRVTTQDGASTLACGEHLWTVTTPDDRRRGPPARVADAGHDRQAAPRHTSTGTSCRWSTPSSSSRRTCPMDPYALGLLLGDGCVTARTTPGFATADPELVEAMQAAFDGVRAGRRHEVGLDDVLRHADGGAAAHPAGEPRHGDPPGARAPGTRSSTKFVPCGLPAQLRLGAAWPLLQGLLDTDGGPGHAARPHLPGPVLHDLADACATT